MKDGKIGVHDSRRGSIEEEWGKLKDGETQSYITDGVIFFPEINEYFRQFKKH